MGRSTVQHRKWHSNCEKSNASKTRGLFRPRNYVLPNSWPSELASKMRSSLPQLASIFPSGQVHPNETRRVNPLVAGLQDGSFSPQICATQVLPAPGGLGSHLITEANMQPTNSALWGNKCQSCFQSRNSRDRVPRSKHILSRTKDPNGPQNWRENRLPPCLSGADISVDSRHWTNLKVRCEVPSLGQLRPKIIQIGLETLLLCSYSISVFRLLGSWRSTPQTS